MKETISASQRFSLEQQVISNMKRIFLASLSENRHIFIRIPLKISIILACLVFKLISGGPPPSPNKTMNKGKPFKQSSPSSISVVLDCSGSESSHTANVIKRYLTFSLLHKSTSQSSFINFFQPIYSQDNSLALLNSVSDILNSAGDHSSLKLLKKESFTEYSTAHSLLDCDNFDSSFSWEESKIIQRPKLPVVNTNYNINRDEHINEKNKLNNTNSTDSGAVSGNSNSGLPDLINQKGNKDKSTDKARKYLEGLDGVKFNEVQVPDTLKKQLEYFDRDELLQLIAYQKKYLDFKESRIKDLENYIDNLVVKIIETEPLILMNASNVLTKSRNLI